MSQGPFGSDQPGGQPGPGGSQPDPYGPGMPPPGGHHTYGAAGAAPSVGPGPAGAPPGTLPEPPPNPNYWASYWWVTIALPGLLILCCCGGCILLPWATTQNAARAYDAAAAAARAHPVLMQRLGTPVEAGWAAPTMSEDGQQATMTFSVTGPQERATLDAVMQRTQQDNWVPLRMEVQWADGAKEVILP